MVAVVAGTLTVVLGIESVVGAGDASASLDSELRFYAAWYVLAGILLLRTVRRVESEALIIRLVFATLFVTGLARVISIVVVGTPHVFALVLLALELVLPTVVIPWQAMVARRAN